MCISSMDRKTSLVCISAVIIIVVYLVAVSPKAKAGPSDLNNPTFTADTPTLFEGYVDDTFPGFARVGGSVANWSVIVIQGSFDGDGINDDIVVFGRHDVAPHPANNEVAPNPNIVIGALKDVVPGAAVPEVFSNSVIHPGTQDHYDNLVIVYAQSPPGPAGGSRLYITIEHSEEPGPKDDFPEGWEIPPEYPEETPDEQWEEEEEVPELISFPTLTEWGLIILALLMLSAAGWMLWRRRKTAAV